MSVVYRLYDCTLVFLKHQPSKFTTSISGCHCFVLEIELCFVFTAVFVTFFIGSQQSEAAQLSDKKLSCYIHKTH